MIGNVAEFIDQRHPATQYDVDHYKNLKPPPTLTDTWYRTRGTSFKDDWSTDAIWDFYPVPGSLKDSWLGFRCVADPDQALKLKSKTP